MTWYQKLVMLLGREPLPGSLEYNRKIMGWRTLEQSAKDLFESEIKQVPGQKAKAKTLGLV